MKFILIFLLSLNLYAKQVSAPPSDQSASDEAAESLKKRVKARWKAMIKHRFEEVYQFATPAYRRLFPLDHYLTRMGTAVDWKYAQIKQYSIKGHIAKVKVNVRYQINLSGLNNNDVLDKDFDETWIKKQGQWWYVEKINRGAL